MKHALQHALKAMFTTSILVLPVTLAVMFLYMKLMSVMQKQWSFDMHLNYLDLAALLTTLFFAFLLSAKSIPKFNGSYYRKNVIISTTILLSALVFSIYLFLSGNFRRQGFDELMISYVPTYLVSLLCMKYYKLSTENECTFKFLQKKI
ncbi:hypothetical protein DBR11_01160 [Pedobacter sp. HMWF019]|uniref:hypothetical protein n=1 Tax=Pedobacter sp. HMWF019 TaxID=2056856 RepID=UPI000D3D2823|nr:hypothetical protein [Pedobacter sp. HMWF019]PTT03816.1 hypothetical protein DBR11_01160 [Pedobacter sp. HMWF019]